MSSLDDPRVLSSLVERLQRLTPELAPRWGTLAPGEVLCHLGDAAQSVLTPADGLPGPARPLAKWLGCTLRCPGPRVRRRRLTWIRASAARGLEISTRTVAGRSSACNDSRLLGRKTSSPRTPSSDAWARATGSAGPSATPTIICGSSGCSPLLLSETGSAASRRRGFDNV